MEITLLGPFNGTTLAEIDILFSSELMPDYLYTTVEIEYREGWVTIAIGESNGKREYQCLFTILRLLSTTTNLNKAITNIVVSYRIVNNYTIAVIKELLIHFPTNTMELVKVG